MLRAQGIAGLFGVLTYLHGYCVSDVAARGTNAEGVGAGLSEPLAVGLVEAGEVCCAIAFVVKRLATAASTKVFIDFMLTKEFSYKFLCIQRYE